MKTLLLYSTVDGQTQKIMSAIMNELVTLNQGTFNYDLIDIENSRNLNLAEYQAVLIGSSIRYGHYNKKLQSLIKNNFHYLNTIPSGFFGVNLIARKAEKQTPITNSYTRKFLQASPWHPTLSAVFAGALYYPRYQWLDRIMIQLIMRMTGGETDATKEIEYTDWSQVKSFAHAFNSLLDK